MANCNNPKDGELYLNSNRVKLEEFLVEAYGDYDVHIK